MTPKSAYAAGYEVGYRGAMSSNTNKSTYLAFDAVMHDLDEMGLSVGEGNKKALVAYDEGLNAGIIAGLKVRENPGDVVVYTAPHYSKNVQRAELADWKQHEGTIIMSSPERGIIANIIGNDNLDGDELGGWTVQCVYWTGHYWVGVDATQFASMFDAVAFVEDILDL